MTDKRCGTCRWWERDHDAKVWSFGWCRPPMPIWSTAKHNTMCEPEGTTCPAWQPIVRPEAP